MNVLFDVDGVLIDGWHAKPERRKPWDATLEQDLGVDRDAFREKFFGVPNDRFASLMHACVSGQRDLKDALATVLPAVGYTGPVDRFVDYWFEKDSNINPDVLDIVTRLDRHPHVQLYLATGQEHYRALYLWDHLRLRDHFGDIFYSAKLGHLKSSPRFFHAINAVLGDAGDEPHLFFDDQEEVVTVARQCGWDACVFEAAEDLLNHPRLRGLLRRS